MSRNLGPGLVLAAARAGVTAGPEEDKAMSATSGGDRELATFGGGCFWCIEAVYERLEGVVSVVSGYAGGTRPDPAYREVCSGRTGHAEVVQVAYDPAVIGYEELLRLFFKAHDPTTLNRQGADVGTQYRSIILTHNPEQQAIAENLKASLDADIEGRIITEIKPLDVFYPAEDYHQDYYDNNPYAGYCRVVIRPKLEKLGLPAAPGGNDGF
jgi:methionine-S-sulfoxide reductase